MQPVKRPGRTSPRYSSLDLVIRELLEERLQLGLHCDLHRSALLPSLLVERDVVVVLLLAADVLLVEALAPAPLPAPPLLDHHAVVLRVVEQLLVALAQHRPCPPLVLLPEGGVEPPALVLAHVVDGVPPVDEVVAELGEGDGPHAELLLELDLVPDEELAAALADRPAEGVMVGARLVAHEAGARDVAAGLADGRAGGVPLDRGAGVAAEGAGLLHQHLLHRGRGGEGLGAGVVGLRAAACEGGGGRLRVGGDSKGGGSLGVRLWDVGDELARQSGIRGAGKPGVKGGRRALRGLGDHMEGEQRGQHEVAGIACGVNTREHCVAASVWGEQGGRRRSAAP
eukprot:296986-Hanusia_phi.AAC.4